MDRLARRVTQEVVLRDDGHGGARGLKRGKSIRSSWVMLDLELSEEKGEEERTVVTVLGRSPVWGR